MEREPNVEDKLYHKEGAPARKTKMTYVSDDGSLMQRLGREVVMSDGMLSSIDQTNFTNLLIANDAVEENIEGGRTPRDLAP